MFEVQHITSFDLPELAPYRTMRFQLEQRQQGIFIAESEKVTRRLLASELPVVSVIIPDTMLDDFREALEKRPEVVRVYCAPKSVLEQLTGYEMYQGILAVGRVPEKTTLDSVLSKSQGPVLLAAADGIGNSQNLGVLVRNCAAFSANALLVGETSCSPFLRRAVAASMGTIFQLPSIDLENLAETIKELRARGIRCIAAHPHIDKRTLPQTDFTQSCCIVFGSEGQGIRPQILELCDEAVAIPMPPDVDSLNVGSASAVFLYEVARQRKRV
ncbi:MAG: TrmH family RNA methyltransferase [Limisphaerales bacterium]